MNSLKQIKKYLAYKKCECLLIPKNNEFFNEYINNKEDYLKKISNFTGSLGFALIFKNSQFLYVDGRYTEQAKTQCKNFKIKSIFELKKDLKKINNQKKIICINPKLFKNIFFKGLVIKYFYFFNNLKKDTQDLKKIIILKDKFSGEKTKSKIQRVNKILKLKKDEVFFLSSVENIAWISNIRSLNKEYTYLLNCHALIKNSKIYIFTNKKINKNISKKIIFKKNTDLKIFLKSSKKIVYDKNNISLYYQDYIKTLKIKLLKIKDPIFDLKSIKNSTEINNLKIAHLFDGIAYIKFLFWLKNNIRKNLNEITIQKKLEAFKKKNKFYMGPSFETISAVEKNAAIIHYNAKNFVPKILRKNNMYLLDAGSQYFYGTTDMTRTFSFSKQKYLRKKIYTIVLKSHIAVAQSKIKKNTIGKQIDYIARKNLIKNKLNYNHGTGHGVGYFSNVHESPPSISQYSLSKFQKGQVLSNEPGFYKKNDFGVRLENLVFINKTRSFETLTLVPFNKSMILKKMLTKNEKKWINDYHDNICEKLKKFLTKKEKEYLEYLCSIIN
jgi:Xaa-Pro aminopeptidase